MQTPMSSVLVGILPLGLAVMVSLLRVRGESCGAMTLAEPGDDRASLQAKAFANFRKECRVKKKLKPKWPRGVYGLPMPIGGCPTGSAFTWQTGSRFQDTENDNPSNSWSDVLHLRGPYARDDIWQHFCMKTVDVVDDSDEEWPNGQYCVFKFGDDCPNGMSSGYVYWDDQDGYGNKNTVYGTVPTGEYDDNTGINFCCMDNGLAASPITLPTGSPFYLFPFTEQCQEVKGMGVTREWFGWDNEDDDNSDELSGSHPYIGNLKGHVLYNCYYRDM